MPQRRLAAYTAAVQQPKSMAGQAGEIYRMPPKEVGRWHRADSRAFLPSTRNGEVQPQAILAGGAFAGARKKLPLVAAPPHLTGSGFRRPQDASKPA
jgi:hypothetical protein